MGAAAPNTSATASTTTHITTGEHSVQYRNGIQQIRSAVDELIKAVDRVDHETLNENLKRNKQQQRRRQREENAAKKQQSSFLLKTLRGL